MRLSIGGDDTQWRRMVRGVQTLTDPGALARLVYKPVGEKARSLVLLGIRQGKDPYGAPHPAPLLRSGLPLNDTGLLRASVHMVYGRSGCAVTFGAKYSGYLQGGTGLYGPRRERIKPVRAKRLAWTSGGQRYSAPSVRGLKPRRMVPDTNRPSPTWERKLRQAAIAAMQAALGGK